MIKKLYCILIVITAVSCSAEKKKTVVINPAWTKRDLHNGWTIHLPLSFRDTALKGIDSQPGAIYSAKDSILLNYDSGGERLLRGKLQDNYCDLSNQVKIAEEEIKNDEADYFQEEYKIYNLRIDTIDGKVAIIRTPKLKGSKSMGVQISDCKSGKWLRIYGQNFSKEQEDLVLEILETIRLEN